MVATTEDAGVRALAVAGAGLPDAGAGAGTADEVRRAGLAGGATSGGHAVVVGAAALPFAAFGTGGAPGHTGHIGRTAAGNDVADLRSAGVGRALGVGVARIGDGDARAAADSLSGRAAERAAVAVRGSPAAPARRVMPRVVQRARVLRAAGARRAAVRGAAGARRSAGTASGS